MAKRGRPTKAPAPGAKASLGLKVTASLKKRLEEAAEASGRTQSQEAEYRLERSFDRADLMWEVMELSYGREAAALILLVARAMTDAGRMSGYRHSPAGNERGAWIDDRFAYEQAQKAAATILDKFKPPRWTPTRTITDERFVQNMRNLTEATDSGSWGEWFAKNVLDGLRGEESTIKDQQWIERMKGLLGPLFDRLPKRGDAI